MYYQYDANYTENNIPFRKKNAGPFSQPVLRAIAIGSLFIGMSLLMYSATMTGSSQQTTQFSETYAELDNSTLSEMFDNFKINFNKSYNNTDEESARYYNFRAFLKTVDERNNNDPGAIHGITKFADLSDEEFRTHFLGYVPTPTNIQRIALPAYTGSETVVNWANIYTTAVKDQGYCGSCWAFSATEQIESDSIRLGLLSTNDTLSPEQIVQCDTIDDGCDGGNTATAFEYVMSAGGIETEANYPYTSYYDKTGTCTSNATDNVVTVSSYTKIADEDSMISYVLSTGPLSICLDASSWSSYVSGVITTCGKDVDHCVQAVGINLDEGYWIVRNSWGTEWGDAGYIYLASGENMCDISYDPKYVETVLV
jgi:cathepsin F